MRYRLPHAPPAPAYLTVCSGPEPEVRIHKGRSAPLLRASQFGFTLIELIVTMVVLGILGVSAVSRFTSDGFDEARHRAQVISSLRNIQQRAMQATDACYGANFNLTSGDMGPATGTVSSGYPCGSAIDSGSFLASDPGALAADGIVLSTQDLANGSNFSALRFTSMGRPLTFAGAIAGSCASGCEISFSGDTTVKLCIEAEGYVHEGSC